MTSSKLTLICLSILFALLFFAYYGSADPDNYGTDLGRYYLQYTYIVPELSLDALLNSIYLTDYDLGFNILLYLFKAAHLPFWTLIYCIQFLYIYSISYFAYKYGRVPYYLAPFFIFPYLCLFLPSLSLVAIRQGICIYAVLFCFLPSLYNKSSLKTLGYFLICVSIHLSAVITLPFYLLYQFFPRLILSTSRIYPIMLFLYLTNTSVFFSSLIGAKSSVIARSFTNDLSGYEVGMTAAKFLSIAIPFLLYLFSKTFLCTKQYLNFLYSFYFFICTTGIIFSGFPYNDRVFLIAWPISPLLVICSLNHIFKKLSLKTSQLTTV